MPYITILRPTVLETNPRNKDFRGDFGDQFGKFLIAQKSFVTLSFEASVEFDGLRGTA
ncbi:hypothetical protein AOX55_0000460 [Sinorhizobium fredii CCBAU 25509]|nr:hypothetical protein AOX55_0000460 [Sinorhizobium fredii CCBAU 25509]